VGTEPRRLLVTGPSDVGKTRTTARLFEEWVADNGPDGVVLLDFAPEIERDGRLLGGRLTRFVDPGEAWYGAVEAHAPRAEGDDEAAALALARENGGVAAQLLAVAPAAPRAVFVNDATIPFQDPDREVGRLLDYVAGAERVVCNALDSDELGTDDPVSRAERASLGRLREWADAEQRLEA